MGLGGEIIDFLGLSLFENVPKAGGIAAPIIGGKGRGSVNVTVELPEGSSLSADTGFAEFRGDGRLGDVDVKTGAGNVRLDKTTLLRVHSGAGRFEVGEVAGNAEIVTAGVITIGTITGDAEIKNHSGKTSVSQVGGNVRVKSANGDITIGDAGGDVMVKTATGDIRLGRVVRGSATVETAAGELEIGIREGTAAWIDAKTGFGQVRNLLTPVDEPDHSTETVQVRARTSFGDVLITRS